MSPSLSRQLNTLGLFGISAMLLYAFADQLVGHELPCPLCLLQRVGLIIAGFGLALNVRFGPRPSHYALTMLGALAGAVVAGRQTLLHIVPGTGSYGAALFGLHFYTWAFVAFALILAASAVMLLFDRQFADSQAATPQAPQRFSGMGRVAVALLLAVALGNAVSTVLECGGGICPADPVGYQLLGG